MSERVPRFARWVIRFSSWVVPAYRRAGWRRQWIAEVEHRCAGRATARQVGTFALGSLSHALFVRKEEMTMRGWAADLKQSIRALFRNPGFTVLTVATLGVGIGSAAGVFSIVETMLLRPLPMDGADQLVRIFSTNPSRGSDRFSVSHPDYADFMARSDLFSTSSFYMSGSRDLSGEGDPERIRIENVGTMFFQTLASGFVIGRGLSLDDHRADAERAVVLAEPFWARRFGSDSTVVGRAIRLDGVPHTVVGVVRDGESWPTNTQAWIPLQWGASVPEYADARSNHTWQVIARLQPDIRARYASEQVRALASTIYSGEGIDERNAGTEAIVVPLGASDTGGETAGIFGVLGVAVFLVLLIACLNASGLLLTRAWGRARELSLRAALGAGRVRLGAILLGESLILALAGGALGLGLAHWGLLRVVRTLPTGGPDLTRLELNSTVAWAAVGISVVAALLAGLVPAVRVSRVSVSESLKESATHSSQGRGGSLLRRGLVVTELALSLALLVGAGLTVRGFQKQIETDPGFDPSNLLTFTVRLPSARYEDEALTDAYYRDAVDALQRHPSVVSATTTSRLPLGAGGFGLYRSFIFDGAPSPPEGTEFGAAWVEIDADYFPTLGVEPVEGRSFLADDRAGGPLVAIVNQRLARQMSPDASIVGRRIRSFYDENMARTVVGVVTDIQFDGLSREQREALVFVPRGQAPRTSMAFMVRVTDSPAAVAGELRSIMADLDPDVALDAMQSLREAHGADLAGVRFLTLLFATFGAVALVLAVSGVYGLVSYSVSQRTREIGIRMAIGASADSVRSAVLREGLLLAAVGLSVGLLIAYGFSRLLAAALFGIMELDPVTFVGVVAALAGAVVAASWVPAVRATRVDPVEALRSE
jgi:putative ABC transport system permease protein